MLINELGPDDEDEKETKKSGAEEEDEVVVVEGEGEEEGGEEESRPARQRAQEGEEGLTEDQRRDKRRTERKAQKTRRREFVEHLKQQNAGFERALAEANVRIQKLESSRGDDYAAKIDAALAGAQRRAEVLKAKIRQANEDGKSDELAAAVDELADVKVDIQKINDHKTELVAHTKKTEAEKDKESSEVNGRGGDEAERREVHATISKNVNIFANKHPWYLMSDDDEDDADEDDVRDSQLVRKLDKELTKEGSNPATAAHWQELEARIQEELPRRKGRAMKKNEERRERSNNNGASSKRRGPAMGGGSRNGGGGDGNEFVLSKARVEAMKEAGIWEDPERKKKAIANYRKFDALNKDQRS